MTTISNISQEAIDRLTARRGRLHIFEDIDPARTAHVIIDMQNGFLAPGQPVEMPNGRKLAPNINRISAALRAAGGIVVHVQYACREADLTGWSVWFDGFFGPAMRERFIEAFTPGSDGHAIWPEIEVAADDLRVEKSRFGAFAQGSSELHRLLQERGVDTIILTGVATNVCCESTAREAMMLNYRVIFVADGTAASIDSEHTATLASLFPRFVDVMDTANVVECIAAARGAARQAAE